MPIIPKRNLHVKPFNPAMLENNQYHRNMSILKPECWVILVLAIILLIAGVVHTLASFTPRVEAIQAQQASMAVQIRTLQSEQAEMRRAVDAWPGITQATTTDPTAATTTTVTMISRSAEVVRETAAMTETVQPTTTTANMRYAGEFKIYAYCGGPNGLLTASGATCKEGVTVAAVWSVFPSGTRLYIDGIGIRIVEDKCSNPKALDVYWKDRETCINFGVQTRKVWVIG